MSCKHSCIEFNVNQRTCWLDHKSCPFKEPDARKCDRAIKIAADDRRVSADKNA